MATGRAILNYTIHTTLEATMSQSAISMTKQYRTREGLKARIVCVDRNANQDTDAHGRFRGPFPVVAIVSSEGWEDEAIMCYTAEGIHSRESRHDLIEVKPRIKREYWVNLYPGDDKRGYVYADRREADDANRHAPSNRLACVKVTIDCEEGEGL